MELKNVYNEKSEVNILDFYYKEKEKETQIKSKKWRRK
jgi:hypothetical protein